MPNKYGRLRLTLSGIFYLIRYSAAQLSEQDIVQIYGQGANFR